MNKTNLTGMRGPTDNRAEQGWVLIAALLVATVSASLTVGWARHAVLSKGQLEMSTGASRTEEASRSGLERTRELMRKGKPPGTEDDGEEDVVTTSNGDSVHSEREEDDIEHDKRDIKVRAYHSSGNSHKDAAVRSRAKVVPGSQGKGKRTRLDCVEGSKIIVIPGLTMVTGMLVLTPSSDVSGVYLLENGATLVMEDIDFTGAIVTRASLCETNALATGGGRPTVQLKGGCVLRDGPDLPGLSLCGPDLVITADTDARIDVRGMIVAEDINLPCRGVLREMVVSESTEVISSNISRPGHDRGPQDFPSFVKPGSEKMTYISFPTEHFTDDEMDTMEAYDVDS